MARVESQSLSVLTLGDRESLLPALMDNPELSKEKAVLVKAI